MGSHSAKSRQESGGVGTVICPGKQHFAKLLDSSRPARGLLHTEEVTGSIPVSPTRSAAISTSVGIAVGAIPVARAGTLPVTRTTRTVAKTHAGLRGPSGTPRLTTKCAAMSPRFLIHPVGQEGRPSKSLTFGQAVALIRAARSYGLHAYVVLSFLVGVRTEEARALRWDHVDLGGNPDADPPVPPHVDVWRSVRAHGDTKTKKSRRSLGLPRMAAEVLREHLQRQADARLRAGVLWQDNRLVFTTALVSWRSSCRDRSM